MRTALVCGAGGFIGSHIVKRLKADGFWVRGIDIKHPEFSETLADDFVIGNLVDQSVCRNLFDVQFDEVYQLAADMGGAGYIFTGENDANVMYNSASINLNIVELCRAKSAKKVFFSSSACVYPQHNQTDASSPVTIESSAYPANPDSDYGWEKLFSERLFAAYGRNSNLDIRIARYHNIYGPEGTWQGGKEKAPAAICRKVALAKNNGSVEIWGDGNQTRSFLFIDDCVNATINLMRNKNFKGPVNIGSEEMVSINQLADLAMKISGKKLQFKHIAGPQGVRGRNSHNALIKEQLGWEPNYPLSSGLEVTYHWIEKQINASAQTLVA